MSVNLGEILDLVGPLDDSVGNETPRERFRRFISKSLTEVGQIRDCVEECLRKTGDQYNRALQDLVNHIGSFLGFAVTFGRYRGVHGEIGFDGLGNRPQISTWLWRSRRQTFMPSKLLRYWDTSTS